MQVVKTYLHRVADTRYFACMMRARHTLLNLVMKIMAAQLHAGECTFEEDGEGLRRPRVIAGLHSHANSPHESNLNVYAKVGWLTA